MMEATRDTAANLAGGGAGTGAHGGRRRVALVTNIPTPYRVALFGVLSEELARRGWELRVFFGARTYRRRKWADELGGAAFDYELVRSAIVQRGDHALMVPLDLGRRLSRFAPDVTIVGGLAVQAIAVALWSRLHRRPYIVWSGEVAARASSAGRAKKALRSVLARNAAAFVAYGTHASRYLASLAPATPNHIAWNTVDVDFFRAAAAVVRQADEPERAAACAETSPIRLLSVGYLTPGKGLDLLVRAVARLRSEAAGRGVVLDIVGDGPARGDLEALVAELGLADAVSFAGNRARRELPGFYGRADIFVFPTLYDIWGLVLVEAMASGLPVVASQFAGATSDIVSDGVTGLVVDPHDTGAFAAAIEKLVADDALRSSMSEQAAGFASERLSLTRSAEGFVSAIEAVA